ncbi:MAG: S9 family peptidase [Candidatus Aminicenantes bacterium]
MKKIKLICVILTFALTAVSIQAQEKRPMTIDDALNMVQVGNPLVSPDGNWVLFSQSELNWEENKRETKYYMVSAEGGEPFQYIGKKGGSRFQFSPDGRFLTFLRKKDEKQQIFLMRTSGGEAVPLTEHKNSIGNYKWGPGSQKIYFVAEEPLTKEEKKEKEAGYDSFFVDEGPNGQTRDSWENLWVFDVKSKKEIRLTEEDFMVGDFDISPDNHWIVFTARYSNRRNDRYKDEIYLFDIESKEKKQLTNNKTPESGLTWSPNGKIIAYLASGDQLWLNRNAKVFLMDIQTEDYRLLSQKYEGTIRKLAWTQDSQNILFQGQQRSNVNLYTINIQSSEYRNLTNVSGSLSVGSFSRDRRRIAYTFSDYDTPSDVYVTEVDSFKPVQLSNANPWVKKELLLADMKILQWESIKDFTIEGLLHLPSDYKKGQKLPLLLNIHGGPAGCFTNSFRAHYHIYAGLGYASLSPNVRGSSGYTDKLREGNTIQAGDGIGKGDFWDLMKGMDHVIAQGYADPDKLALRGWSYGGILGGWTITQTHRFKAASLGAGVYAWPCEYGPGFNHDVRLWHIGGTPWTNTEAWLEQSAFTHVENVKTPTFLIHGMKDTTDTEAQSMLFFTALKDIEKAPVRYVRVPREPHGFREPRHQRTRTIEEIKWFQKHVLNKDWNPWERESEKKDKGKEEENKQEKEK